MKRVQCTPLGNEIAEVSYTSKVLFNLYHHQIHLLAILKKICIFKIQFKVNRRLFWDSLLWDKKATSVECSTYFSYKEFVFLPRTIFLRIAPNGVGWNHYYFFSKISWRVPYNVQRVYASFYIYHVYSGQIWGSV